MIKTATCMFNLDLSTDCLNRLNSVLNSRQFFLISCYFPPDLFMLSRESNIVAAAGNMKASAAGVVVSVIAK